MKHLKHFTIIWENRWQVGSHWHCLAKKQYVSYDDSEGFERLFEEYPGTVFIFEGFVQSHGEIKGDIIAADIDTIE